MWKMQYYQESIYSYKRSKRTKQIAGKSFLFLYAGLTKKREQTLGTNKRNQITTVASHMINCPIIDVPEIYLAIPEGDSNFEILEEEFDRLLKLSETNVVGFFTYSPKVK